MDFTEYDFNVLKEKTIDHYNKMIEWAKKRNQNESPDSYFMECCINEEWSWVYCLFCNQFEDCDCCIISFFTNERQCKKTPWYEMDKSITWAEWLINAEKMKEFINQLEWTEEFNYWLNE